MKYLFLILILLVHGGSWATEQSLPGLTASKLYYWVEPTDHAYSVSEVLEEAQWHATDGELNFGYSNDTIWVMQNVQIYRPGDWVMQIPYPLLDYLDVYLFKGDQLIESLHSGDARNFDQRIVKVPDFILGMTTEKPAYYRLIARIETQGTMMLPIKWWAQLDYAEHLVLEQTIYGAYYGILLVMALYHLFIYLVIREKGYLYYVLTVSAFFLLQLCFDGRGFSWLWPKTPEINLYSFPLAYSLYQIAVMTFMSHFLQLKSTSGYLHRYFLVLRGIVVLNVLGLFISDYSTMTPVIVVTGVIAIFSGLFSGAYLWFKGFTPARYFTCAWAVFLGGILLLNFRGLGIGETNWISVYGYVFGSMLEVLFLAFSLADRIASSNKERRKAERELIKSKDEHLLALQKYQNLYENAPIGNFQSNQFYSLTSVNRACAKIFGFEHRSEMLEKVTDIREYLRSNFDEFQSMVRHARKHGHSNDNELLINNANGEERWISISLRYFQSAKESGFEGTVQDITGRKLAEKLQAELDQERLSIMEQFSLGIAKEINMPLGSNVATTSFIREGLTDIEKLQQLSEVKITDYEKFVALVSQSLSLIANNQKRITKVVKRFREVSSWHIGLKASHIVMLDMIENVINAQRWRMAGWRVEIDCDPNIQVYTFKSAMNSIFEQLIDNALNHSHADDGQTPMIHISVKEENKDYLSISFTDNGVGIKKEWVKNLCKPFFTTKKGPDGHIGLGLYMVYNLACQALKGRLFFPIKGQGFSIQIVIPKKLD